jgi:cell division protein ZapA (FtsZ GTPase activity inhibitor)
MKKEFKSHRVVIVGDEYLIMSDETEEHIVESANHVHILLQEATRKTPSGVPKRLATVAALHLASELFTLQKTAKVREERVAALVYTIDQILRIVASG